VSCCNEDAMLRSNDSFMEECDRYLVVAQVFDLTRTTLEYHEQRRKFLVGSLEVLPSTSSHP
jgi:hypothetical protein